MSVPTAFRSSILVAFSTFVDRCGLNHPEKHLATEFAQAFLAWKTDLNQWSMAEVERFAATQATPSHIVQVLKQFIHRFPPSQIGVFLHEYLLALTDDGCSNSTIRNYRSDINQFASFAGVSSLNELIAKPVLSKFVRYEEEKGLQDSSIRRKLASIAQFGLWAHRKGILDGIEWLNNTKLLETIHQTPLKAASNPVIEPVIETPPPAQPRVKVENRIAVAHRLQEQRARLQAQLDKVAKNIKQQSQAWLLPYLTLAVLVIAFLGLGVFGYQQFINNVDSPLAFPSAPTRPNRVLSFQGRLTDTAQNPITTATNFVFKIYDTGPGTGGTELWSSGTCSVTPDQDGIFAASLGDDCGSEISSNVFTENANTWLSVQVAAEVLAPRQPINTVAYALNSETLQGYPISATAAATVNTVLFMNGAGDLVMGEDSPGIRGISGTFILEAPSIQIQTTNNGNIILDANGTGGTIINDLMHAPGATLSANYAGGTALTIKGGPSGTANILSVQDSSSNVLSVFDEAGWLGILNSNPSAPLSVGSSSQFQVNSSGAIAAATGITSSGTITFSAFTANGGLLYTNGSGTLAQTAVGGANECLLSAGGGSPTWGSCSAAVGDSIIWQQVLGTAQLKNTTLDLLVGGTSTVSAKFALINVNSGSPTATIAGNLSLVVPTGATPAQTLNILNGGTLTIKGAGTGQGNAGLGNIAAFTGEANVSPVTLYARRADNITYSRALATNPGSNSVAMVWINPDNVGGADTFGIFRVDGGTLDSLFNVYGNGRDKVVIGGSDTTTNIRTHILTASNTYVGLAIEANSGQTANLQEWQDSAGAPLAKISANGYFFAPGATISATYAGGVPLALNAGPSATADILQIRNSSGTVLSEFDESGNLGIGTTSPQYSLDVVGGYVQSRVTGATATGFLIDNSNSPLWGVQAAVNGRFEIYDFGVNANRFTISTAGLVGIGTTAPAATLDVRAQSGTLPVASISGATSNASLMVDNSGVGDIFTASSSGLNRFVITQNGNVGIGTTLPGSKLEVNGAIAAGDGTSALPAFTFSADTNTGIYRSGADEISFQHNGTTSLKLTQALRAQAYIGNAALPAWSFLTDTDTGTFGGGTNVLGFSTAGLERGRFDANGNFGVGTTSPTAPLHIAGAYGSNDALTINQLNSGNIFTASASGVTKFTLANNGNITATGTLTGLTGLTSSGTITFSAFTANGGLLYTNGSGVLAQSAVGNAGECLISAGGGSPTWTSCSVASADNFWRVTQGAISPYNDTLDLLIGSNASTSAKFAFLNVNSGVPTASIAGTAASGNALSLTGDGTIATTLNRSLILNPNGGNVGIGTTAPNAGLTVVNNTSGTQLEVRNATGNTSYITVSDNSTGTGISNGLTLGYNSGAIIYNRENTAMSFGTNATTRMTIAAGGTIGIGTTVPLSTLDVRAQSGTLSVASVSGQTSFAALVADNSGVGDIFTASSSGLNRFVIKQSGNVGIGTTLPGGILDAYVNTSRALRVTTAGLVSVGDIANAGGSALLNIKPAVSGDAAFGTQLYNSSTYSFFITATGLVGVGTTAPNATLDVVGTASVSSTLSMGGAIQPSTGNLTFNYKSGANTWAAAQTIDTVGNLGIGTTAPLGKLHVLSSANNFAGVNIANTGYLSATSDNSAAPVFYVKGTGTADLVNVFDNTTEVFTILDGGNVGIGSSAPAATLDVQKTADITGTSINVAQITGNLSATTTISNNTNALNVSLPVTLTGDPGSRTITGITSNPYMTNSSTVNPTSLTMRGIFANATNDDAGQTLGNAIGLTASAGQSRAGGTTTNAKSIYAFLQNAGTITDGYNVYIDNANGAGTINNQYGLYIADLTDGTANYALVTNAGNVVFNEGGDASTDFRIEGDTLANLLFIDASADAVGIGDSTPDAMFTVGTTSQFQVNSSGAVAAATGLTSSGTITFSAFTANGGLLYTNGSGTVAQTAIGSLGECLKSAGGGSPTWGSCAAGAGSNWRIASGAISPINDTLDLLIGSNASASAKFAVLNVNSGVPTASIAGTAASGNAVSITGDGTIATTLNRSLLLNPSGGNVGIGTTSPGYLLDIGGFSAGDKTLRIGSANAANSFIRLMEVDDTLGFSLGYNGTSNLFQLIRNNSSQSGDEVLNIARATGDFSFNSGDVYFQNSTGNVGIGTTSPLATLHVVGTASVSSTLTMGGAIQPSTGDLTFNYKSGANAWTTGMILNTQGRVGIGTTAPAAFLDVAHASGEGVRLTNSGTGIALHIANSNADADPRIAFDVTGGSVWNVGVNDGDSDKFMISDDGAGSLDSSVNFTIDTSGNVGIGTTSPASMLSVGASSQFQVNSSGEIATIDAVAHTVTDSAGDLSINSNGGSLLLADTDTIVVGGLAGTAYNAFSDSGTAGSAASDDDLYVEDILEVDGTLVADGTLDANGVFTLGDSGDTGAIDTSSWDISSAGAASGFTGIVSSGTITFSGLNTAGGIIYAQSGGTLAVSAAGNAGECLVSGGASTPTWTSCSASASNYWRLASGALSPVNDTTDLLIGSNASSSARFAVLNVNTAAAGVPTASASAGTAGAAFLTAAGNVGTTAQQSLTLGGATSGDVLIQPNSDTGDYFRFSSDGTNLSLNTTDSSDLTIDVSGSNLLLANGDVLNAGGAAAAAFNFFAGDTSNNTLADADDDLYIGDELEVDGAFSFGDSGDTGAIDTSDWDISSTGNLSSIGTIGMDGDLTMSQADPTINLTDTGGDDYTVNVDANAFTIINSSDSRTELSFDGAGGIDFGDNTATKTIDIGGVTSSAADTINIGTNATAADVISIGNSHASTTLALTGGDDWSITAAGILDINGAFTLGDNGDTGAIDTSSWDISSAGAASGFTGITSSGTITFSAFTTNGGLLYTNGSGTLAQSAVGSAGECLTSAGGGSPVWASCAAASNNYWRLTSGAFSPVNDTADLLIGGVSTAAAKFRFINVNTGTPTASISANSGNIASYHTGDGTIATTNRQTLTIGNSSTYDTTGNVLINPNGTGRVGIGTTSPSSQLEVSGDIRANASNTNGGGIYLKSGTTHGIFYNNPDVMYQIMQATGDHRFYTNSTEKLRITNVGSVGIGTTAPTALLHVSGAYGTNDAFTVNQTNASATNIFTASASGTTKLALSNAGALTLSNYASCNGLTTNSSGLIACNTNANSNINYWQSNLGLLSPYISSYSIALGGTATSSANIHLDATTGYINAQRFEDKANAGFYLDPAASTTSLIVAGSLNAGGATAQNYNFMALSTAGNTTADNSSDLYIQDELEVDGAVQLDGTLTANGQFTLGDNGDTGAINTSDWDISTAGAMTGISGITNDGSYTQTGTSANTFTGATAFTANNATALTVTDGSQTYLTLDTTTDAADTLLTLTGGSTSTISTGNIFSLVGDTITTGKVLNLSADALTSGNGLFVDSTSTGLTGAVASFTFNGVGTVTGDLLSLDLGATSNVGKILNVKDNGSTVFSVGEATITSALPHEFTAAGDLSVAYDIQFTNQTASFLKSYGPLTIESGESFESQNLTFKTYNSGRFVFTNETNGTLATLTGNGLLGIGTTSPTAPLHINGAYGSNAALIIDQRNSGNIIAASGSGTTRLVLTAAGSLGIGSTSPQTTLDVTGTASVSSTLTMGGVIRPDTGSLQFNYKNGLNTWSQAMTINTEGLVGIGTSVITDAQLVIAVPEALNKPGWYINTEESTAGVDAWTLESDVTTGDTVKAHMDSDGTLFVTLQTTSTQGVCHVTAGAVTNAEITDCNGTPGDYAEWYPIENNALAGDIVAITPQVFEYDAQGADAFTGESVQLGKQNISVLGKAQNAAKFIGVVSTAPHTVIGEDIKETIEKNGITSFKPAPVALSGRVPVKMSSDSPAVQAGDLITVSTTQLGKGTKASGTGMAIGKALEDWSPASGKPTVLVFINYTWYDTDMDLTANGNLDIDYDTNTQTATLVDENGDIVEKLGAFSEATIANLEAGVINARKLIVDTFQVTGTLIANRLNANQVATDLLTPVSSDDLAIKLESSQVDGTAGELKITNENDQEVASIDGDGNATFSGTVAGESIEANEADITSARIETLESRLAEVEKIKADTAEIVTATVSGTLYADNIYQFQDKVAAALQEPSLLSQLMGNVPESSASASLASVYQVVVDQLPIQSTGSGSLNKSLADLNLDESDVSLGASAVFINNYFELNGSGYVSESLGIGQNLLIGNGTQISDGIFNYVDPTNPSATLLSIQPSGKGTLSLMAGLMILSEDGSIKVNGNFEVAGNLKVKQTLLTNLIKSDDLNKAVQVQVAGVSTESGEVVNSRFEITNELNAPVATISAQGKATFADGISVGSDDLSASTSATVQTNKTSGKATVKQLTNQITIQSTALTANSLIYVTPLGSTGNKVLYVKAQSATEFTVGFDSMTLNDVGFNWWIVN